MTGVGDRDFSERQARDLGGGFGLSLLAALGVEEPGILDGDSGLPRDEHDQVEVVGIVGVLPVGKNLHHADGAVVIGQRRGDLALYLTLRGDLKDRTGPPALWLGGDDWNAGLKNPGDRLGSVRKIQNALALALFRIDDDTVSVELLARRVGNDEGKARRVDDGSDCFVDLAICFLERDSSRDGLLDIGDRRESSGAPLELGDQLSRQRTPPSPGV